LQIRFYWKYATEDARRQKTEDKYYGVLTMMQAVEFSLYAQIQKDEDLAKVYQKLFVKLVEYTGSLQILLLVTESNLDGVPSWIIDWRRSTGIWFNAQFRRSGNGYVVQYPGATGKSVAQSRLQNVTWDLLVSGRIFAQISYCSSHFASNNRQSMEESLKIVTKGFVLRKGERKAFLDFARAHSATTSIRDQHNSEPSESLKPLAAERIPLIWCVGQEFNGFGSAAPAAKVGDVVTLIRGVSLPMVLRECEGGYMVVGPAFLQRLMDGEFWVSQR
jgi:hypothetical protein